MRLFRFLELVLLVAPPSYLESERERWAAVAGDARSRHLVECVAVLVALGRGAVLSHESAAGPALRSASTTTPVTIMLAIASGRSRVQPSFMSWS